MNSKKDVFGHAIAHYFARKTPAYIKVYSPEFDEDEIPVEYLFRSFENMPTLEQKALQLCQGKTLDVGCGAGSHSLYLQKFMPVTSIDTSPLAIQVCKERGLKNAQVADFFTYHSTPFDTILFMMNGIGIVGKLEKLAAFFDKIKQLLSPNGQVLLDSSNLIYLFPENEEEAKSSPQYYGEMEYHTRYLHYQSDPFYWLYLDFDTLQCMAELHGFTAEKMMEGEHYEYLARLTFITSKYEDL